MRYALAPIALAALVAATPVPQGVTESIAPDAATPSGCETSYSGEFNIQIVNVTDEAAKRMIRKRQSNILSLTLTDGKLTDSQDRTGYIAANSQFQFDGPPQTGAIYTAGWSVCSNNHLTLGDDDVFYSCLSGNFYNLYDENVLDAEQCTKVYIDVIGSGSSSGGAASVQPDGQPTGSAVAPVSQIPDGQITGSAVAPVTQISDGQIQQPQSTPVAPVTQISDGQIQQPQSTPVAPVTQISDGQIQAPSGTGSMPSANGTMVYPQPSAPIQQTGAASPMQISSGLGLFAAIFGVAML